MIESADQIVARLKRNDIKQCKNNPDGTFFYININEEEEKFLNIAEAKQKHLALSICNKFFKLSYGNRSIAKGTQIINNKLSFVFRYIVDTNSIIFDIERAKQLYESLYDDKDFRIKVRDLDKDSTPSHRKDTEEILKHTIVIHSEGYAMLELWRNAIDLLLDLYANDKYKALAHISKGGIEGAIKLIKSPELEVSKTFSEEELNLVKTITFNE